MNYKYLIMSHKISNTNNQYKSNGHILWKSKLRPKSKWFRSPQGDFSFPSWPGWNNNIQRNNNNREKAIQQQQWDPQPTWQGHKLHQRLEQKMKNLKRSFPNLPAASTFSAPKWHVRRAPQCLSARHTPPKPFFSRPRTILLVSRLPEIPPYSNNRLGIN